MDRSKEEWEKLRREKRRRAKKFERSSEWSVNNKRPEEFLKDPDFYSVEEKVKKYYTDEEVERYCHSGGMKRAQERIAKRILEFLNLKPGAKILDIGSGPGYSSGVYRSAGYSVTCLDLVPKMIEKAREKGFEAYIGNMANMIKIFNDEFDAIVSASALQWVKDREDIKDIAKESYSLLKNKGQLVIQFYPKSQKETEKIAKIFTKNGFYGKIITDWPDIPKKRTIYLVMNKK